MADRVHILSSSGIWNFWDIQDGRARKLRKLAKAGLDDLAPLTTDHDAVHLLFVLLGVLFAGCFTAFIVELAAGFFRNIFNESIVVLSIGP